jgi:hypothetical protein
VLCYPRLQKLYGLAWEDIVEHVELLRARADLVSPIVYEPIVFTDPVVYTAVAGRSDVLCALDRDFYTPQVISFCSERGIEILNDVELLERLKQEHMA